jgi:serine protease Do
MGTDWHMLSVLCHQETRDKSRCIRAWVSPVPVLVLGLLPPMACTQVAATSFKLTRPRFRSGEETLRAFAPVAEATRHSIVKFEVDGETVALGAVVDTNGLVVTKASEIHPGKLMCWLADEKRAEAELIRVDEDVDMALVRVHARGLKPIQWAETEVVAGQWAITSGIVATPHAVGIISALPRRIRPQRGLIGVQFDLTTATPRIGEVLERMGAEKVGLKPGDVITAVNSTVTTNHDQVAATLREFRSGQTVKLRVQRQADQFEVAVQMMVPGAAWSGRGLYPQQRFDPLSGDVSQRAEGFEQIIEHDTVLQPWLCGGPLVDLDGKAIGLNIARAGRVSTYALPAGLVKRILAELEAGPEKAPGAGK